MQLANDPWPPRFPPEVPFPERPGPTRPILPGVPAPVVHPAVPGVPDLRSRVYDDLLRRRTVVLDRPLDAEVAGLVTAQLVALDHEGGEPITLVVNSPGGPLDAGVAVLDAMDLVRGPVHTTCLGRAEGTAAVVLASATGRRRIGAGARVRLRFADLDLQGPANRLDHELAYHRELQATVVDRLAAVTRQERALVQRDVEAGRPLTAPEAVAYGLADEVIGAPTG